MVVVPGPARSCDIEFCVACIVSAAACAVKCDIAVTDVSGMTMDPGEPARDQAAAAAPPQYSADGHWWWNGTHWISAATVQAAPEPPRPATPRRDLTASSVSFSPGSLLMVVAGAAGVAAALWLRWATVSLTIASSGTVEPTTVASGTLRRFTYGHAGIAIALTALVIALIGVWLDYHGNHVPQLSAFADGVMGLVLLTWTVHAWIAFAGDKHNTLSFGSLSTTVHSKVTMGPAPYVFLLVGVVAFVAARLEWKRADLSGSLRPVNASPAHSAVNG
jgi:hypothetical protein